MRLFFLLALCCLLKATFAQDDIPDYRSRKDNFSKMMEKDLRADVSQFSFAGIGESLTKHKLDQIPVKSVTQDSILFANDTMSVHITTGNFDASKHKVSWADEKYAVKLDNHPFWGTENKVPKHTVASVVIIFRSDTLLLPPAAYGDLYEPHFFYTDASGATKTYCNVYVSADHRKQYIYMLNGEGTGRYEVTWIIQDKHYLRRVVDWGFDR